jgi:hypothetical protein
VKTKKFQTRNLSNDYKNDQWSERGLE